MNIVTWESVLLKEPPNRYSFNPSSIHFTNGYFAIGRLALAHLSACSTYDAVVVLNELQQLLLLWIWIQCDKSILQRNDLEVLLAKIQYILLALLQLASLRLELLWRQVLLLASLLYRGKFLLFPSLLVYGKLGGHQLVLLFLLLSQVQVLELVNRRLLKSLAHISCFESPRWTWKNQ